VLAGLAELAELEKQGSGIRGQGSDKAAVSAGLAVLAGHPANADSSAPDIGMDVPISGRSE